MHVYLVRHGETLYNRSRTHQHAEVPLSEKGKNEARAAGIALRSLPQPYLVTSTMARAKETAEIIGKIAGVGVQEEQLFREMKRPSQVVNAHYYGFTSLTIGLQLLIHAPYASWHYSDEENLHEIRARVTQAISYLESIADRYEHVVVVSHAVFIKLMLIMLRTGSISISAYFLAILKFTQVRNASITRLTCVPDGKGGFSWSIDAVSEVEHLAE